MSKLMSRLEWTWRLVMTGLCFALFGLGGLLLSVVWFNILLVLVWDTSRRRRLSITYCWRQSCQKLTAW